MEGLHLTIDLYHCRKWYNLQDPAVLEAVMREAIEVAEMQLVQFGAPLLYEEFDSSLGWGWSVNAVLADSHSTMHTAPSKNSSAFFDIYSCKHFDLNKVLNLVLDNFAPARYELRKIPRNRYLDLPEP